MKKAFLAALATLLLGGILTFALAGIGEQYSGHRQDAEVQAQLREHTGKLAGELSSLLRSGDSLAAWLASHPDTGDSGTGHPDAGQGGKTPAGDTPFHRELTQNAANIARTSSSIVSVVAARDMTVYFVYPLKGNEAVMGLNFNYRPDFIGGIKRAIAARTAIVDGPLRLIQSNRQGLVIRSPVFDPASGNLAGLVSIAVDLEILLGNAGLNDPSLPFVFALRGIDANGASSETFLGDSRLFQQHHITVDIPLPDGKWQIVAAPRPQGWQDVAGIWLIRGTGGLLSAGLALLVFVRVRAATRLVANGQRPQDSLSLRTSLVASTLLVLLPVVGIGGALSLQVADRLAGQFSRQLADEVSQRVRDKVMMFFDVPQRVVAFNVEQARAGFLAPENRDQLVQKFLIQLRQQPLLTFVSMGAANGEYFAASRPPLGGDKTLRILNARIANKREMQILSVDDTNRPGPLLSRGNRNFDARERPWFKDAASSGVISWYSAYRYAIDDERGDYNDLGIGISAPIYDGASRFLGVVTADVALSQLGGFLQAATGETGGIAFLAESGGELLATSTPEPIYSLEGSMAVRKLAWQSDNPVIARASRAIQDDGQPEGHLSIRLPVRSGDSGYLVQWQRLQLPHGPALTIGIALPEELLVSPARAILGHTILLALAILGLGLLTTFLVSGWVSRPLVFLSQWASRLAAGDWSARPPLSSPVREVVTLSVSLEKMAGHLKAYTEELEQRVQERTRDLETANRKLAELSATDGLTGLANRRRLDEVLATEWARAGHSADPLAVVMLDIDHFKKFNDHYGHQAGDDCLRQVSEVLRDCARRAGDLAARYGGEEFCIIAADTDSAEATRLAETLRQRIAALAIPHQLSPFGHVTASIGVAVRIPEGGTGVESLLQEADSALYRAKAGGRNQVCGPAAPIPARPQDKVAAGQEGDAALV